MVGGGGISYKKAAEKYNNFEVAQAHVLLNGKPLVSKKTDIVVGEITVELTSGFEASVANFRIYNTYIQRTGEYNFKDVEKQAILGVSCEIFMGYLGIMSPVFLGFVAGVSFGYDGITPPYIEITAMDAKGVMMATSYAEQLTANSYCEAVRQILKRTAGESLKSAKIISEIKVTDTPDKPPPGSNNNAATAISIEMVSESDYDFIVKAAKKFNYEFYVDRGLVIFRKAKGSNKSPIIKLGIGMGILTYNMEYSLTGIVQNIEARAMNAGDGKVISAKAKYDKDLSPGGKAKALIKKSNKVYIDPSIVTQEHADARVASLMEEMSFRLGSMECDCIGIPEILPGNYAEINVGSPADNNFYLTNVIHKINSDGIYSSKLIGRADRHLK
jgi:hypothetical protein